MPRLVCRLLYFFAYAKIAFSNVRLDAGHFLVKKTLKGLLKPYYKNK